MTDRISKAVGLGSPRVNRFSNDQRFVTSLLAWRIEKLPHSVSQSTSSASRNRRSYGRLLDRIARTSITPRHAHDSLVAARSLCARLRQEPRTADARRGDVRQWDQSSLAAV